MLVRPCTCVSVCGEGGFIVHGMIWQSITKPLDVCVDKALGKSMLSALWSSDLTPDRSTSLPLQVR